MRELARNRSIRHDGVMSDILHKIYIEFTVGAVWPYQALLVVFLSVVIHRLRRRDWRVTWAWLAPMLWHAPKPREAASWDAAGPAIPPSVARFTEIVRPGL